MQPPDHPQAPASPNPADDQPDALRKAFTQHPRDLDHFRYVYCVVSRRAGGLSIGINLNPDKVCNFSCVYCQVDRILPTPKDKVDLAILEHELTSVIQMAQDGRLTQNERFKGLSQDRCRPRDVAFAGDGEPTSFTHFDKAVQTVLDVQKKLGLNPPLPVIVMTNASGLEKPASIRALDLIYQNGGEIWAKLDAGTEAFFQQVSGTRIPFSRILANIEKTARRHPIVIQSMFMQLHGNGPSTQELEAYADRLRHVVDSGGIIRLVQIYTVARQPAQSFVSPLPKDEQDNIGRFVREKTGIPVELFY